MTVQQLINLALQDLGVLASGETPATEESNDAFSVLNQLVKNWSAQALPIYQITRSTVAMSGQASYALASRPVKIKSAAVVTSTGVSKPARVVDSFEWGTFLDKAATGNFAEVLWYDGGYPTGTVYLAPKPTGGTLELYLLMPLTVFGALGDTVTLPDGYERALRTALAFELAPQYGRQMDPALSTDAKTSIFGLNQAVLGPPGMVAPPPQAG